MGNERKGVGPEATPRSQMSILDMVKQPFQAPPATAVNRQRIDAAVAFHIGGKLPGIDFTRALDPISSRFAEMAATNPALVAALEEDVNAFLALDDSEIAAKLARGEPLSQFGDVFDAIAEVSWEIGATDLAARLNAESSGAVKGRFDALTLTEALDLTLDGTPATVVTPGARFSPDYAKAASFQTLFDTPGAWSYSPASRILAVTVGGQTIGVETRPGFNPENHLDVMAEVVSAQADGRIAGGGLTGGQKTKGPALVVESFVGVAHDIGGWIDQHPGVRTSLDALWDVSTRFSLWNISRELTGGGSGGQPLARHSERMRDEKGEMTATSVRLASVLPFPEDAITASLAREWMAESGGQLDSQTALGMAASTVAENRDQLTAEYENLTAEELVEELEAEIEGESSLGRAIESGMGSAVQALEEWDRASHWIGVNWYDVLKDLGLAGFELATGDPDAGFEHLRNAAQSQEYGTTAADYFGITDPNLSDGVNLLVSLAFDPANLIFPGGKGLAAVAQKGLTDPKYAGLYLKMGQFPHIAKQIAEGGRETVTREIVNELGETVTEKVALNNRGVMSAIGTSTGMKDPEIVDLMKLALDPDATVGQVNAVLTRAMAGDWLGEGSMRMVRHSTVEGMGRMLDSLAAGKISQEHLGEIMQFFTKASVGRTIKLGENQSLDAYGDLIIQFFPTDPERAARLFVGAAEARMAGGDDLAMSGVTQTTKEQARRAVVQAGGTRKAILGANEPGGIADNLRTIEDNLAGLSGQGLDETAELGVRTQLNELHRVMSRRLDEVNPQVQAARDKSRLGHQQIVKATVLEGDMAANASRNVMAAQFRRLYEEVAQDLNKQFGSEVIPIVKGKVDPLVPGLKPDGTPEVPVRDWSAVTGVRKPVGADDRDLGLMMGLAVDDADLARQADAVGMFNRSQKMLLPASPYEILIYKKLGHDKTLMAKALNVMRRERLKRWVRHSKLVFAFNLLVNPLTAGKITLDETLRFLADTGRPLAFARATAVGLPGIGRPIQTAGRVLAHPGAATGRALDRTANLIPEGGAADALRRTADRFNMKNGEAIVNPYAKAHGRNVGGFSADDFADYGWVDRPGPRHRADYRDQVERWVNGSLLQDRRFREYARWVDAAETLEDGTRIPPSGWSEWWEHGPGVDRPGKADVNPTTVTLRGQPVLGTELNATDAFNIVDRVFDNWLNLVVDESARPLMRKRLLDAARGGTGRQGPLDVVRDARLLNAVARVPGLSPNTGFGSRVFNVFFGAPSGRRAGVFFEHYYAEAMDILTTRHGERVLTVDKLMEFAGVDKPTAEFWLKQGSDNAIVSRLIRETGARTEAQLAARAANYAERRADDLMYRFTATSLAGRGVEAGLVMPFARAQVDFLSWWMDHMFKPMTLRIPLEVRGKLPGMVQDVISQVERIPLNVRAWSKYAHLAAVTNNDQESVIDQTIDNVTFFPLKFGSEFLVDVSPQFGPVPAWMFDLMVDAGWIDEDLEQEVEAVFPALDFTDADNDDLFDRILPNSRRSIRDLTMGMMQSGYALVGDDIHTDPGIWGQIANIISEGKEPAATGDFQAAGAADFLKESAWDIVPGSDEWHNAIREVAIAGATEANRAEFSQDIRDRVFPLATYDREYRAMRAYESLFSEERFAALVSAGIFAANDLLENDDGVPRVLETWRKYEEGTATQPELEWLDDRVTTAYFNAGRLEVLPGLSYMDFMHLKNPELSVNLIQKSEDSGAPVRNDEHAEFKQTYINALTGRVQNIPEGDTGREIRSEARRRGWIVSVPVEDWATDASQAVYKSGQRALRGVWESVSHRTWQQGLKKSIEEKTFTLPGKEAMILQAAGMDLQAGQQFTYAEFHQRLDDFDERFDVSTPVLLDTLERGAVHGQLARHNDEFGQGLLEALGQADRDADKLGYESIEDWPEPVKERVRDKFRHAIDLGYTTVEDYTQEIAPLFGPLDYSAPVPPPVDELEAGVQLSGDDLADLAVIDGDTVSLLMEDGPMRIRLIGLNAPEATQGGYQEARSNLEEVIGGASEVTIGIYQPEVFGLTQTSAPGERRLLAFLYVDGVPIYDPSVFTSANPRGAGVSGNVVDLMAILEAGDRR